MRETGRHPQHVMVLVAELGAPPLAEGRRAAPQIHHRVEHRARRDPHELSLGVFDLQVHAAQGPLGRPAMVVLDELDVDPGRLELGGLPGLHEKPALVAEHLGLDQNHLGNRGLDELHG